METKQRLYDLDDLWELYCDRSNDHLRFELTDGEIIEMSGPGGVHGQIAIRLGSYMFLFVQEHNLGIVTGETGYHPPGDRYNLLLPDIAFISHNRAPDPFPEKLVPAMPDIAVEIRSPSNTREELREKAERYLLLGTALVWTVLPAEKSVEVCRMNESGETEREMLGPDATLSGENVLPGFSLEARRIFE
ncbi:MAG: Uma2 family endonuclease [Chloroflexi bacterium]|nr:Uma2 family endonuclease [Chloroflexota bacterium]